jgi:hypothetical protein
VRDSLTSIDVVMPNPTPKLSLDPDAPWRACGPTVIAAVSFVR